VVDGELWPVKVQLATLDQRHFNMMVLCQDVLQITIEYIVSLKLFTHGIKILVVRFESQVNERHTVPFTPGVLRDTPLFLEIGSFYNSPRLKQLSFTVFESIQPIF